MSLSLYLTAITCRTCLLQSHCTPRFQELWMITHFSLCEGKATGCSQAQVPT